MSEELAVLIKQYAIDLRRNAGGGDDYPHEFAKGVADYLGILIKRAKGDCTCAQAGFPDSCDNCDGLSSDLVLAIAERDAAIETSLAARKLIELLGEALKRQRIFMGAKADTKNPDYPPHEAWDKCQHQWQEVESISDTEVRCAKCQVPGDRNKDGSVYWPAT